MWLHMGSFGPMKVDASIPETISGPPFRVRSEPGHVARQDATSCSSTRQRPACRGRSARPSPKDFFGVDKDLDAFSADDPALPHQIRPLEQPQVHHRRKLRHDCARPACRRSSLDKGVQLNGIVLVSTVLNFADFAGRPAAISTSCRPMRPTPGITARSRTSRPLDGFVAAGARIRQRTLCRGTAEGQRDQRRGEAVGRTADGAAHRSFARVHPAHQPARRSRTLPARAAARSRPDHRPDRFALSRHRGRAGRRRTPTTIRRQARSPAASPARSTTICSATSATRRRSATAPTIMRGIGGANGSSRTSRERATSRSPTPASISPTRCGRTRA